MRACVVGTLDVLIYFVLFLFGTSFQEGFLVFLVHLIIPVHVESVCLIWVPGIIGLLGKNFLSSNFHSSSLSNLCNFFSSCCRYSIRTWCYFEVMGTQNPTLTSCEYEYRM